MIRAAYADILFLEGRIPWQSWIWEASFLFLRLLAIPAGDLTFIFAYLKHYFCFTFRMPRMPLEGMPLEVPFFRLDRGAC